MIRNVLFSSIALLSLGLAACGGGDGDSGSGVDSSKALSDVTPAEQQDLCDYGQSLVSAEDSKSLGCYFSAIFFSETEADCQTAYDACMAEPDNTEQSCDLGTPPDCASEVTVGEMEACAREQANAVTAAAGSLSCASDPAELESLNELPPACKAVETKCPALFE